VKFLAAVVEWDYRAARLETGAEQYLPSAVLRTVRVARRNLTSRASRRRDVKGKPEVLQCKAGAY